MKSAFGLVFIFVIAVASLELAQAYGSFKDNNLIYSGEIRAKSKPFEDTKFFEEFFLSVMPEAIGMQPCNANGSYDQYKDLALNDASNAEIGSYSAQRIIRRSGYQLKTHFVISDDGYITQAVRIINPLVDPIHLKQPPVMIMHGGITNLKTWIFANSIQHHPEKYPRTEGDGPITSYNRSLAFVLANHGYDVWLIGTRGATLTDRFRIPFVMSPSLANKQARAYEKMLEVAKSPFYWHYSMDDIIKYEFPRQIEKVLEVTGAKNVSLMTYSFSTILGFGMLTSNPNLAKKKVHNLVIMAPLLNTVGINTVFTGILKLIAKTPLDEGIGTLLITHGALSEPIRKIMTFIGKVFKRLTYTVMKFLISILVGCSGQYRTFFEAAVLDNLLEETSFVQIKHYAQILLAGRLQRYDYGKTVNRLVYGTSTPPLYDLSNIHVENWMMITAGNDNLGTPDSSDRILEQVHPKPNRHIYIPSYNHIDVIAGFDNGPLVNLNILDFFDELTL